ncbi:hypothetical protein LguiA_025749 [Lonicera macranthoides]
MGRSSSSRFEERLDSALEEVVGILTTPVGCPMTNHHQGRAGVKRSMPAGSFLKQPKQDLAKDDGKSGKVSRTPGTLSASERDLPCSSTTSSPYYWSVTII